jgi:hypothetical protein
VWSNSKSFLQHKIRNHVVVVDPLKFLPTRSDSFRASTYPPTTDTHTVDSCDQPVKITSGNNKNSGFFVLLLLFVDCDQASKKSSCGERIASTCHMHDTNRPLLPRQQCRLLFGSKMIGHSYRSANSLLPNRITPSSSPSSPSSHGPRSPRHHHAQPRRCIACRC